MSGTTYEHTSSGRQPLAGLHFTVMTSDPLAGVDVTSDASGRYRFSVPNGSMVAVGLANGAGYHAPCPAGFDRLERHATLDIHVVADAALSTTGLPASVPTWFPRVSGVASVRAGTELRPVAGAVVELADYPDSPLKSVTLTDANGRYLLCTNPPGTGTQQVAWVTAWKGEFNSLYASQSISISGDDRLLLELTGHMAY